MSKRNIIESALLETLKQHPDWVETASTIINSNSQDVFPDSFTSANDARKNIRSSTSSIDFIEYTLENALLIYGSYLADLHNSDIANLDGLQKAVELNKRYPNYNIVLEAVKIIDNKDINPFIYFKEHKNEYMALTKIVSDIRFKSSWYSLGKEVDPEGERVRNEIDTKGSKMIDVRYSLSKLYHDYEKISNIDKINIYNKTINNCLVDILNGCQFNNKHNDYALNGELFATQDVGKERDNQEDSVIIMVHPNNPDFKLLAVADGMGGYEGGEIASSTTIKKISEWFSNLSEEYYYNPDLIMNEMNLNITRINNELNDYCEKRNSKCGTTLTCAIVTEKETVVSHIGDSRCYLLKDGHVNLLTQDQSVVWPEVIDPSSEEKRTAYPFELSHEEIDELRFKPYSYALTSCIGCNNESVNPLYWKIDNDSYDTLLVTSDGVSDLLSIPEIKIISDTTPVDYLTKTIVARALKYDAYNMKYPDNVIKAGKDNATAAAFSRR